LLGQPLALAAVLMLATLVAGLLAAQAIQHWRDDIIETNMSMSASAARQLAADAEDHLGDLSHRKDGRGRMLIVAHRDSLDRVLTDLATRVFSLNPGLKGGFWMLQEDEFMGYANPWSPPPKPAFGPPPRSYQLILDQVKETIDTGKPLLRLHEFATVSVSRPVFPLATEPVRVGGEIVGVAWARIHIERDLPAPRLSRYLNIAALVAVFAFLAVLLTVLHQRHEIRSLNRSLQLIEKDISHRLGPRRGMFGSIAEAINNMVSSLQEENSKRRQLEMELHQQDKMAALGNLLAGVAHEIKTPLANIKTRVQIWQRDLARMDETTGQSSPFSDDSMDLVLHEINRLSALLRKLLYFSRPMRRDLMRPLDADDLIRHTLGFVNPTITEKRIDLRTDLSAAGSKILGDPDALHQVLLNILTNSIHMVDEKGSIHISSRPDRENGRLVIDVEDSGPGIPPELREEVLTPFYTTRQAGYGLGLAIAYEIVRAHGGTIEFLDPVRLSGAHCRVRLPLHSEGADAPATGGSG
jgi:signal transduction histidine kinase